MSVADRVFWTIVVFVFVILVWLKFVEPLARLSIWLGTAVAVGVGVYFFRAVAPKRSAGRQRGS